jgi:L-asparaginase
VSRRPPAGSADRTPTSVIAYFLGGTISMTAGAHGAEPRLEGDDLVAAVPQLRALEVALTVRPLRLVPSGDLSFADVTGLVERAAVEECDGIVVVQGTDTIEETAYLIDLLWSAETPIVLTGAMRNASLPGADGPANLVAAVTVAASARFRGLGALVVANDEIHAARAVRKMHTTSTAAFASPVLGPLGYLLEGEPVPAGTLPRRHVHPVPPSASARVPLVTIGFDDGGEAIEGLGERCDGVVLLALGGGHVPAALVPALTALAERVPVVLASRTPTGPVLGGTYAYAGSESDLLARGLIRAGYLDPFKARVLLRLLLSNGCDRAGVAAAFAESSGLP